MTKFGNILACINCKSDCLAFAAASVRCESCGHEYKIVDGIPVFLRGGLNVYETDPDRAEFWNQGWEKRFGDLLNQDGNAVISFRNEFLTMLERQKYPAVTEIGTSAFGKLLLNIGCGGGQEGLLFAGYGARYIGVDFSYNAARYTQKLMERVGYEGLCYQAEAEHLPFKNNSFDIIYTNGVLHHTPNTLDTLRELHRVLAADGKAVIGLYATHSLSFYWYRFRAILAGNFSARSIERWLDANTEGEWQTEGRRNQHTRTYSRGRLNAVLKEAGFRSARIDQSQIQLKDLPVLGRLFRAMPDVIADRCVGAFGMMLIATCTK